MIFFLEFNQGVIFQERPSARLLLLLLLLRASGHSSQSPRRCFSSLTFTTKAESLEREGERERGEDKSIANTGADKKGNERAARRRLNNFQA